MTMKDRPNRDALQRAVDIFRDTMRPFIVRNMKNVPRMGLEDALRTSFAREAGRMTSSRTCGEGRVPRNRSTSMTFLTSYSGTGERSSTARSEGGALRRTRYGRS